MNEKEMDTILNTRIFLGVIKRFVENAIESLDETFTDKKKGEVKQKNRPTGSKNKPKGKSK